MESIPASQEKGEGPSDMEPEGVLGLRHGSLKDLRARDRCYRPTGDQPELLYTEPA